MGSPGLYHVDLDPDSALEAVKSGGTILLLDVPPGTCIGIDHSAFSVGEKFVGVKMVPPGVHFVSSSSGDSHGGFAPVVGFFVHIESGGVIVRCWDREEEMLVGMGGEADEERYKQGVRNFDFDSGLAPYDLRGWKKWRGLSEFITEETVERISPVGGCMSVMGEGIKMDVTGATAAERELLEQLGKGNVDLGGSGVEGKDSGKVLGGGCFYTEIHTLIKHVGLSGSELTSIHLDNSPILEGVLMSKFSADHDGLLGELQFAFVSFVMCQSLQGLRQWKSILGLMLRCEHACLHTHQELFVKFSRCLRHQLVFGLGRWNSSDSPASGSEGFLLEGILGESVLDESFLRGGLMDFLAFVHEACEGGSEGVDADLYGECLKIGELVRSKLNWEIEEGEFGEYAPVVVDL